MRRVARLFFLAFAFCFAGSAIADEGGKEREAIIALDADHWPCKSGYQAELSSNSPWPRPSLLGKAANWRKNPDVKMLVESVAMSSRSKLAVSEIDRFVASLVVDDAERDRLLATAFIGLRDEMNLYREMVLYGIMQGVARARLASDIAADAKRGKTANPKTFEEALRVEDDSLDDARFLCRRLDALEQKFHLLAEALARHLTPAAG
ncbi:MAG: hypothetical protein ACR2P3_03960 [Geminicoccaceae bacterium]